MGNLIQNRKKSNPIQTIIYCIPCLHTSSAWLRFQTVLYTWFSPHALTYSTISKSAGKARLRKSSNINEDAERRTNWTRWMVIQGSRAWVVIGRSLLLIIYDPKHWTKLYCYQIRLRKEGQRRMVVTFHYCYQIWSGDKIDFRLWSNSYIHIWTLLRYRLCISAGRLPVSIIARKFH